MQSIGVVVVNWRTPESTIRAVRALVGDGVQPGQIAVVDDASGDDSVERLARELQGVLLVESPENVGYARACNLGAETLGTCCTRLFVNSDAFVQRPGSVAALAAALERPEVGIAVPRLLNEDLTLQRSVVPFRTPYAALVQASGLSRVIPSRFQPWLGTYWNHAAGREIQSATGAVIAVNAAAWTSLGGFRALAHMYAEDHDLCWRAHELGWKTWFTPDAEFVHGGGASTEVAYTAAARAFAVATAESALVRAHLWPAAASLTLGLLRLGHIGRSIVFRAARRADAAAEQSGFARGYRS